MSFRNITDTREGFVNMRAGDKLIRIESIIMGIILFFAAIATFDMGFVKALILGIVVAVVFPWLTGLIESFAWIVTIVFSIIWAVVGYLVGGAILGDSAFAGAVIAIIVFIVSFFLHKIFAGLGYSSVEKHVINSMDTTANNTTYTATKINNLVSNVSQKTYCSNCGTELKSGVKFCNKCGNKV